MAFGSLALHVFSNCAMNSILASDKPDLGLEELASLNVKSRFQVFEQTSGEKSNSDLDRSPSAVSVKRSPSILSKLAR